MTRAEPHHTRPISPRRRARRGGELPQSRQQAAGRRLAGELLPRCQHCRRSLSRVSLHEPGAASLSVRGR